MKSEDVNSEVRKLHERLKDALSKRREADVELAKLHEGLRATIAESAKERADVVANRMLEDGRFIHLVHSLSGTGHVKLEGDRVHVPSKDEMLEVLNAVTNIVTPESDPDYDADVKTIFTKLSEGGLDEAKAEEYAGRFQMSTLDEVARNLFPDARRFDMAVEVSRKTNESPRSLQVNEGIRDADLMATGLALWEEFRDKRRLELLKHVDPERIYTDEQFYEDLLNGKADQGRCSADRTLASFAWTATRWADHAFQRIVTTHTYAAALMCTDASKETFGDLEVHWHGFLVIVPNGLLKNYDRILVGTGVNRAALTLYASSPSPSEHQAMFLDSAQNLADLLFSGDDEEHGEKGRLAALAKRLVAGILFSMQHENNFRDRKSFLAYERGETYDPRVEPAHRVTFIGRPISIDCRPALNRYLKDGPRGEDGRIPTVQSLVRGHQKRQVIGVGRLGRKVIWIEPYWRGPEDAPILTKPRRF